MWAGRIRSIGWTDSECSEWRDGKPKKKTRKRWEVAKNKQTTDTGNGFLVSGDGAPNETQLPAKDLIVFYFVCVVISFKVHESGSVGVATNWLIGGRTGLTGESIMMSMFGTWVSGFWV